MDSTITEKDLDPSSVYLVQGFREDTRDAEPDLSVDLMADAHGTYTVADAKRFIHLVSDCDLTWFEEPVSSDDLEGLRLLRDAAPPGMEIAAGEYGYDVYSFRRRAEAGAVDVLQADATRCAGITGFLQAVAIGDAWNLPLSSHTAPALHVHVCCAAARVRHLEYFHDHVRVERLLFDGAPEPVDGVLHPDRARPGLGLELKRRDAEKYAA